MPTEAQVILDYRIDSQVFINHGEVQVKERTESFQALGNQKDHSNLALVNTHRCPSRRLIIYERLRRGWRSSRIKRWSWRSHDAIEAWWWKENSISQERNDVINSIFDLFVIFFRLFSFEFEVSSIIKSNNNDKIQWWMFRCLHLNSKSICLTTLWCTKHHTKSIVVISKMKAQVE